MITLRKDKIWLRLENYENAGKLSLDERGYTLVKLSGKNQTHAFGQIKQKHKLKLVLWFNLIYLVNTQIILVKYKKE